MKTGLESGLSESRKTYEPPRLIRQGDFRTLTRGGLRVGSDAPGSSKNP